MSKPQFNNVKALVRFDLQNTSLKELQHISKYTIETYAANLRFRMAHLCKRPITLANVNRIVEKEIVARSAALPTLKAVA